jgi:anti-sigma B factor antagonist
MPAYPTQTVDEDAQGTRGNGGFYHDGSRWYPLSIFFEGPRQRQAWDECLRPVTIRWDSGSSCWKKEATAMAMTINVRKKGETCIVEVSGKIVLGEPSKQLREKVKELLGAGERMFILDMSNVPWMDSSGIGEVVACRNRIVAAEGKIRAVLNPKMHDLFTLFELQKVLKYYRDIERALASFVE